MVAVTVGDSRGVPGVGQVEKPRRQLGETILGRQVQRRRQLQPVLLIWTTDKRAPAVSVTSSINGHATVPRRLAGTLGVDGWAVTFGTARRGLGGTAARAHADPINLLSGGV